MQNHIGLNMIKVNCDENTGTIHLSLSTILQIFHWKL